MNYFRIQKIEVEILAEEIEELQREMKRKVTQRIQVGDSRFEIQPESTILVESRGLLTRV
jgi:hypothetical protein